MTGGALSIVIIHGVADATRPDEQDTLTQVGQVSAALERLGHHVEVMAIGLDLTALTTIPSGTLVFNLVEAIGGDGRLIHLAPAALEHLSRAFTGSGSTAMVLSSSKTLSKPLLRAAGLEIPEALRDPEAHSDKDFYIVKSEWEDASYGMDAGSVVEGRRAAAEIAARAERFGGTWFAERFIDGREFNISLLGDGERLAVLPAAEIVFQDYPRDRPRIVDYEAKWDAGSFAYRNTVRRFLDAEAEPALAERIEDVARRAYSALGLCDYGRVDIRLSHDGTPYVLEVNANPCLSADAGFAAAAAEAGLGYDEMIARIVQSARVRLGSAEPAAPARDGSGTTEGTSEAAAPVSITAGGSAPGASADEAAAPRVAEVTDDGPWRFAVRDADIASVRSLVDKTGFFTAEEIAIAAELVEERIAKGPASGYEFVLHHEGGRLLGYTCFGLIPGSGISWDLYWIAVDPEIQGQGLGRRLLAETERIIASACGRQLYADTSSSPRYIPTRAYYLAAGFREAAQLPDFYRAGDGKVIFVKEIAGAP